MKRLLAAVLVATLAPWTRAASDENARANANANSHANANENATKCPPQLALNPSYLQCIVTSPITLGVAGVVLSEAFCQSTACYSFWSGLASKDIAMCLPGGKIGSVSVSDANSMKDCFTNGGVLTSVTATTTSPPSQKSPTPSNASENIRGNTSENISGSTSDNMVVSGKAPQRASSADRDIMSAGKTDMTAAAATTMPTTVKSVSPLSSTANKDQLGDEEDVQVTGSGGDRTTVKTVKSKTTTTAGGVVGNEEDAESASNSAKAAKKSNSSDGGSQSAAPVNGDEHRYGASVETAIWIVSCGTGGSLLVLLLVALYLRKHKAKFCGLKGFDPTNDSEEYVATFDSCQPRTESFSVVVYDCSLPVPRCAFWDDDVINAVRLPYEKLERGSLLSRGGYGQVHRGMYRGQPVAIKSLLPGRRTDMRQIVQFMAEVKLMAALEHEHIVRFVGVAWDSLHELCVVSAFMAGGDLRSLLARYEASKHPKGFSSDKTKMAMHIAHALTYMHSLQPPVLHRDLKSRNILLDAQLNSYLTDFGISRERADTTMTIGVGSSLWMAPEVMTGGRYDEKADVFSFGVVLSELDVHTLPYAHAREPGTDRKLPDTVVIQMMIAGQISVQFTGGSTSSLAQLGRRCVALDPDARPTAAAVQHQLHQLRRQFSDSL